MANTWTQVRANFIQALAERRVDRWLVEESKTRAEIQTKFYELDDIMKFAEFLDSQVAKEEAVASGENNGGHFISFTPRKCGGLGI
jgi:hypothetical protein